jgi:hypothetical protein
VLPPLLFCGGAESKRASALQVMVEMLRANQQHQLTSQAPTEALLTPSCYKIGQLPSRSGTRPRSFAELRPTGGILNTAGIWTGATPGAGPFPRPPEGGVPSHMPIAYALAALRSVFSGVSVGVLDQGRPRPALTKPRPAAGPSLRGASV